MFKMRIYMALGLMAVSACGEESPRTARSNESQDKVEHTFFESLAASDTGIDFINEVADRDDLNILNYRNFYNGGGVAIGDINNDDLPDIYFTANLGSNRLYLNKGNFVFEDITEKASVAGSKAWSTGATMADVNHDGWLDIYLSHAGNIPGDNRGNELFLNNGDLTFTEKAAELGLNDPGLTTQASFFDYDLDGDLDCYVLNNSFTIPGEITSYGDEEGKVGLGGDRLYRNDGGTFTAVNQEAGIGRNELGFGLGVTIGDVNQDYFPDIYVSNDDWERDYLYINQGDGTFKEELKDRTDYCSTSSTGGDIADLNNDGYPEIVSTDRLAADHYRLKAIASHKPHYPKEASDAHQIGQNCLHRNDGQGDFQEVGMLAGIGATDWSWGALVFDFENDGQKDLFVSNGIQKDLLNLDFRDYLANNDIYRKLANKAVVDYSALIDQLPSKPISNYAFANQGGLQFKDQAEQLGLGQPSFSNGASYADLDNDGDMDLVINNVNSTASIYRNQAERVGHHYLKIKFKGNATNPFGIGARVSIQTADGMQLRQNFNGRGFQSSVEPELLFGLGEQTKIDHIEVVWPDRKRQILENVAADQTLTLNYTEAIGQATIATPPLPLYAERSRQLFQGNIRHQENRYNDFEHDPLMQAKMSTEGPRLIRGDANGDGLEDVVLLGARGDADKLYLQTNAGTFSLKSNPTFEHRNIITFESSCGAFLDFDQDGDLDLLIGAAGNEHALKKQSVALRFFRNDGNGNFALDNNSAPAFYGHFSSLEVSDIDQDGDPDVFLGGRLIAGNYGLPAQSYLLLNDNGRWRDIAPSAVAGLGMVADACWADIDGDGDDDLVAVSDWGAVKVFRNDRGQMRITAPIERSNGWWRSIEPADLDGDGDVDFVLGNWGLNTKFKASTERPIRMYVSDFDQNNRSESIITWYPPLDAKAYPFAAKAELLQRLPILRDQLSTHERYAKETFETLFDVSQQQAAIPYTVTNLQTSILWNNGGKFSLEPLPREAQLAPVYAIAVDDFNNDAELDIWLGGNFYATKPEVGRQAASRGVLLLGKGNQQFESMSHLESGIKVKGEVRDAKIVMLGSEKVLLVARNSDSLQAFKRE